MRSELGLWQCGDWHDQHLKQDTVTAIEDLKVMLQVQRHKMDEAQMRRHEETKQNHSNQYHRNSST